MNIQSTHTDGEWGPCPTGELDRMVGQIRATRRRVRVRRVGGTVAALALFAIVLAGGRTVLRNSTGELHYGGIACSEVASQLIAYHEGKLPAPLAEKIRLHLAECPMCGPRYERMFGRVAKSATWEHGPIAAAISQTPFSGLAHSTFPDAPRKLASAGDVTRPFNQASPRTPSMGSAPRG